MPSGLPSAQSRHPSCVRVPGRCCPHLWLQTIFDGCITAFAATPPLSGCRHASTPLSTRYLSLLFRLIRTGICTPSSNRREPPSPLNLPPKRNVMHGVRLSAERGLFALGASVYRSFRHEPRGSFRLCPSSLRLTARGVGDCRTFARTGKRLSLHCITRHPLRCLLRQSLHFPFASRQLHFAQNRHTPCAP